ncbi:MAG: ORF6N domain-containing protein [Patescibacteria group bacterium]|nr:ORF6N domain-containing protein [Patescibacteria group bacterium]
MKSLVLLPQDRIENKIFFIKGKKVMLDRDLSKLYGVETKKLNQAVKRNIARFPTDFMFQLSLKEFKNWKSHFVTSNSDKMGLRKLPYAFTEQGIAMLSSVLNSERAIQVNIQIIRTFTKIRELIASNKELREQIEKLEKKYDQQFRIVFDAIKQLLATPSKSSKSIGFNV